MTALASALTAALIDFAWQGILVAALLAIILLFLRNSSAKARYLASSVAMLAMITIPIVTTALAFHPATAGVPASGIALTAPAEPSAERSASVLLWLQTWALPAWSLGVLLFSCRLIIACCQLSAWKRRGTTVPDAVRSAVDSVATRLHMTQPVRIILSSLADAPSVAGFLRPIILLPLSSVSGLAPRQLEAILAHELAHILRYDPLMNMLQVLIETLLFYHPAVWWISARMRHERELCCDDLAVACCGDALCYARALTAVAKLRNATMPLTVGSNGGSLLYRIRRIMGERPTGFSPSKLSSILALSMALACLTINVSMRMQAQDSPKQIYQSSGVEADTAGAEVTEPIHYPRAAAEKGIQGTVIAQVDVDAQGIVTDARVLSGPPELRSAVLLAVLSWRFKSSGSASVRHVSVEFRVPPLQELDRAQEALVAALKARTLEQLEATRQSYEQMRKQKRRKARLGATIEPLDDQQERKRAEEVEAQLRQRKAEQDQIASQLREQMVEMMRRASGMQKMEGRILARIESAGLSDEQRAQVIGRLPVKIGEKLSTETIERVRLMLRPEHLECQLVPLEDNQSVLKISGEQNHWAAERISEQLAELDRSISKMESQLGAARKIYTEQHPDLLALKSKLNQSRERREVLLKDSPALQSFLLLLDRQLNQLQLSLQQPHDAEEYARILEQIQQLMSQREIQLQKQDILNEHFGGLIPNETRDSQSK